MSNFPLWKHLILVVAVSFTASHSAGEQSRLATYDHQGETYFALSLKADLNRNVGALDLVVLFDTSASQTGAYRDDALKSLESMLSQLDDNQRVRIYALDLEAVPMGGDFASGTSDSARQALAQLRARLPLGSTDLVAGMNTALAALRKSTAPKRIVYIGDGASKANMLQLDEFQSLVDQLVAEQISVSSLAIGPQRDAQLLSTFANHTGGNVVIDNASAVAEDSGASLAKFVQADVFWPSQVDLPDAIVEQFPRTLPPLRGRSRFHHRRCSASQVAT